MADGTNYTRLLELEISVTENLPAASTMLKLGLYRLSTAGTGGTAEADSPYDDSDAYGGDMRNTPSVKGTEGQLLETAYLMLPTALDSGGAGDPPYVWRPAPYAKPIIFGTATSEGIALKVIDAVASTALCIKATIATTTYK
jgi:hypothetical protein